MRNRFLLISLIAAVYSAKSFGAVIAPDTAVASSNISTTSRTLEDTIDGSGFISTTGDVGTWTHENNGQNSSYYWLSAQNGELALLQYTFSTPQDLSALYLWSYSRTGADDRGINSATISFSTGGAFENPVNISVAKVPYSGGVVIETQTFAFATRTGVTAVNIQINSNHGTNYSGLSEVRFEGVPSIPEPSVALLSAFGALFLLRRRRKQ